ncbi:hypothetical protein BOX15_Mlig007666g2 [Macrostomum lignano]|uniref:Uncharacterized protein n=1 Tax=Macrostomum lignano TaxID=282301 RepID=A0A267GS62_9PLAT|nr:hypothetical protein BOX15_Mlig007666g2 [Macrostomum lignano]
MSFKTVSMLFAVALLSVTFSYGLGDDVITVAEYKETLQQLEQFNIITETLEKIRDLLDQAAQVGREKLMEVLQSEALKTLLNFLPSYLRDWLDGYIKDLLENLNDPIAFTNLQQAMQSTAKVYTEMSYKMKRF